MNILKFLGVPSKEEIIKAISDEVEDRLTEKLKSVEVRLEEVSDDLIKHTGSLTNATVKEIQDIKKSLSEVGKLFKTTSTKKVEKEVSSIVKKIEGFLK